MGLHSERQACPSRGNGEATDREVHAVAKASEAARSSGTPNSLIVTRPAVGARALRANLYWLLGSSVQKQAR
jgi:hypothetical protein